MAPTDLPGEAELRNRIGRLLDDQRVFGVVATSVGAAADDFSASPACEVVLHRLHAVVRGSDLLAFVAPCTFVLVSDELDALGVPHLEERLRDAVGLPVVLENTTVALASHQSSVVVDARPGAVVADRRNAGVPTLLAPEDSTAVLHDVLGRLP